MLSRLLEQAGNTDCVIVKTLTQQEKVVIRRKSGLNLLKCSGGKKIFSINSLKTIGPSRSHSKAQDGGLVVLDVTYFIK